MNSLTEYLEKSAQRFANKPALIQESKGTTFRQLKEYALQVAASIRKITAETQQVIAVLLPKGEAALGTFLGILYSNNIYAPLDPQTPTKRLSKIIDKLQPRLIINEQGIIHSCSYKENGSNSNSSIEENIAYIFHTSGSSGTPKGVAISHSSVIDYIQWAKTEFQVTEGNILCSQAPFHFDNSIRDTYLCLATGATLAIPPPHYFALPHELARYLVKTHVNTIFWVPSAMAAFADNDVFASHPKPPLHTILFAGEVMPPYVLKYWQRQFPEALFANLYGPTEATVDCTFYKVEKSIHDEKTIPIGKARPGADVFLLNEAGLTPRQGEAAEICISGNALAWGYWNDSENTAKSFPMHNGKRIYRSGDRACQDEAGNLIFIGRLDQQIKRLGYRIELGEIEAALRELPAIQEACAHYCKDSQQIQALIVSHEAVTLGGIRRAAQSSLPKYMLPDTVSQVDQLPKTPQGKIDRQAAKELFKELQVKQPPQ